MRHPSFSQPLPIPLLNSLLALLSLLNLLTNPITAATSLPALNYTTPIFPSTPFTFPTGYRIFCSSRPASSSSSSTAPQPPPLSSCLEAAHALPQSTTMETFSTSNLPREPIVMRGCGILVSLTDFSTAVETAWSYVQAAATEVSLYCAEGEGVRRVTSGGVRMGSEGGLLVLVGRHEGDGNGDWDEGRVQTT